MKAGHSPRIFTTNVKVLTEIISIRTYRPQQSFPFMTTTGICQNI